MRKLALAAALVTALVGVTATAGAGGLATGYTLSFTSATVGDATDLVATLTGGDCDGDLRIALFEPDGTTMVTDNGNGGVTDATQIGLTNPGSLVTEPGTYIIRVTCSGTPIGGDTPFEVLGDVVEPPIEPPVEPPVDDPGTGPVDAAPAYTG